MMRTDIIQDVPLNDITQDKFGREPVVDLIVGSINQMVSTDHSCMVYGIYGKWGEGKTSLMNFVKSKLFAQGKDDGIIIAEFNPWLVNNDEALLQEFFKTIMADADSLVREAFKKYGSLAILASKTIVNAVAPGFGSALAKGIKWAQKALEDSKDALSELKEKASEAIVKSGKHLIVMIDDVDRLDKEELHSVMRLIRQVADFKNCIYLVAMDVDMVAKSIAEYHGKGSLQDGRKFIDKIVQVPITIPQIPHCDMEKLIKELLVDTLQDATDKKQIEDISESILPFIGSYRELKRYCNQLSFVLLCMKGEVNILDLCLLEAIKMIDAESYGRIYERENALRHIVDTAPLLSEDKGHEEAAKNYEAAREYITRGIEGKLKEAVLDAIDYLFENGSIDSQLDIDKKRLNSDVYFQKYFTQLVPSELIPDRELDSFRGRLLELNEVEIAKQYDDWLEKYSASEVKRAALYTIRRCEYGNERCWAASITAKALSVCKVAQGLPPHVYVDPDVVSSFVAIQIIHRYLFVQDEKYAQVNVWDADLLDDTFSFIFEKAEMNYGMNLLASSDSIFGSGVYNGKKTLPILIKRFVELGFDKQFKYSKFLLITLFNRWKRIDTDGFNEFAKNLFVNPEYSLARVLNKFIDGTDDGQDVVDFVGLFKVQVPQINERLQGESQEVRESYAAKIYASNYRPLLEH